MDKKTAAFIEKANAVHSGLYKYDKVHYINSKTKVCIIDSEYGEFWQTPNKHLSGRGCPERYRQRLLSTKEDFIKRARVVHGNLYDYTKVRYAGSFEKVVIIDPEYGEFLQSPKNHLEGSGHPERGIESAKKANADTLETFIEKARNIHGNDYDYTKVTYVNCRTPVCVVDSKGEEFWITPASHVSGIGNKKSGRKRLTNAEFINKAKRLHQEKYDYSKTQYGGYSANVVITSPLYGDFLQLAGNHLQGKGHPRDSTQVSKPHEEIIEYVRSLGFSVTINNRDIISPFEIDIYIPDAKLGIEIDGAYWHSIDKVGNKHYHQTKQDMSNKAGITLLQFFDYEIQERLPIVKSMIASRLGMSARKIYARSTTIKTLSSNEYRIFLSENHLQGAINSKNRLGLFLEEELVSVLGMSTRKNVHTLDRFASLIGTQVVGGFSKLLKHGPNVEIITHSANRYSTGRVYSKAGFKLINENPYTLYFFYKGKLYSRHTFQSHKLKSMFPDYDERYQSSKDFLKERGVYQIYAAGTKTWRKTLWVQ